MNKILVTILMFITALPCLGQTNSDTAKHLLFKGIPIDGKLDEFVSKLKKVGFQYKGKDDGIAILLGDFASYKSCQIGVVTLKSKDLVNKIIVLFPDRDNWNSLSSNYFKIKSMLTEKYSSPLESVENFQSTIEPSNDNDKMFDVKFDKCNYFSVFDTGKGVIELSIQHDNVLNCFIKLLYVDEINNQEVLKEAKDDL